MLYMIRFHIYLYTFGRFVGTICGKNTEKKQTWTIQVKCPVLNLRLLLSEGLRASMYHLSTSDVDNSAIMHWVSMTSHMLRTSLGHMDSPKQKGAFPSAAVATFRFPWSGATGEVQLTSPVADHGNLQLNCGQAATIVLGYSYGHPMSSPNWGENGMKMVGSSDDILPHMGWWVAVIFFI